MRVAYLGTSDYAVAVLRRLAASSHRPALVVTPPDRRRGRGRRAMPTPVAAAAGELELPLLRVESVNDSEAVDEIRRSGAGAGLVCAFGQLIGEVLLGELEMLNVHPSLLPRWRGAAPIERTIMAGDEETGVTIMRVTERLDSGPIALRSRIRVAPDDDYASLSARLADLGGELAVEALDGLEAVTLSFTEQDDAEATYAEKVSAAERRLDPHRPAAELERIVRALTPHVGAYLELGGGERLGVRRASVLEQGPPAGELQELDGALVLGCAEGGLRLDSVLPPGGRPMEAGAYLRGNPVPRLATA